MTTQEERERALARVLGCIEADNGIDEFTQEAAFYLRRDDTVPVPREELAQLRRALWDMMLLAGYGSMGDSVDGGLGEFFLSREFARRGKAFGFVWTDAAHSFARAMREKGGEGA